MNQKYCDLHTHSLFSDGTYTPSELVKEAEKLGLSAIALCDHNTVSGLPELLSAGEGSPVEVIPGIELSTHHGSCEVHIVGLFVEPSAYGKITDLLEEMNENKKASYQRLVEALAADGYDLDYERIAKKCDGGPINRSHIAEALVERGYVSSIAEAFNSLIAKGGKYYSEPRYIDTAAGVRFLKSVGATTVLAHPYLNIPHEKIPSLTEALAEAGLDAIETEYSSYSDEERYMARALAKKHALLESGGSDFHGTRKPHISLGRGMGNLYVPSEFLDKLKAARGK